MVQSNNPALVAGSAERLRELDSRLAIIADDDNLVEPSVDAFQPAAVFAFLDVASGETEIWIIGEQKKLDPDEPTPQLCYELTIFQVGEDLTVRQLRGEGLVEVSSLGSILRGSLFRRFDEDRGSGWRRKKAESLAMWMAHD